MKLEIYDKHIEGNKTCYFAKTTLKDYIESLPDDFKEFSLQRQIVRNTYLDKLIYTIVESKQIPSIVLTAKEINNQNNDGTLEVKNYEILDGLQRTHHLKRIYDSNLYIDEPNKKSLEIDKKIVEIIQDLDKSKRNSIYSYILRFEVWEKLETRDEVEKMLILNAGHKSMSVEHQLELVFSNFYLDFFNTPNSNIKIIKSKEKSSLQYSKNRKNGELYYSHLISSFLSFFKGKPITPNSELIDNLQNKNDNFLNLKDLDYSFFDSFIKIITQLDKEIFEKYGNGGNKFLSKETVLCGLLGAIGKLLNEGNNINISDVVWILNIENYYEKTKLLPLGKINVGLTMKKAIYNGILDNYPQRCLIAWENYFGGQNNE